jgi:acyl-CoA reductase-like NAD-dependent aldehyde dehydrogenase
MPLKESYPYYLANKAVFANTDLEVYDKYTGEVATRVAMADVAAIDEAIGRAAVAAEAMRKFPPYKRQAVLEHCVARFKERFEELAEALCIEGGKPIKDSRGETTRLIDTFKIAAEEAVRVGGEVMPLDRTPRAHGYSGMWKRVPIGPCSFISPFNFPLNLAAHKVAPAIAAGCPFILKPASLTPVGAIIIGEILAETDLPEGAFSILPCRRDGAGLFTTDDRLKLVSFTGSPDVGWELKAQAGKKPIVLELGGNAACIVDEDADLDDAIPRIIIGGYYQSGQTCIAVQRILVHEKIYDEFRRRFVAQVKLLKTGNPKEEDTFIGPIISKAEADRMERWMNSAEAAGATRLCGGERTGNLITGAVFENVPKTEPLYAEEFFGPATVLVKFSDFDEALAEVNDSRFGLQCGIFTRDIYKAHRAWDTLEVGGVVVGDSPSFRVDHMPYGGVRDSGLGREGIRFAIEDMTEIRLLVLRTPPAEQR